MLVEMIKKHDGKGHHYYAAWKYYKSDTTQNKNKRLTNNKIDVDLTLNSIKHAATLLE